MSIRNEFFMERVANELPRDEAMAPNLWVLKKSLGNTLRYWL